MRNLRFVLVSLLTCALTVALSGCGGTPIAISHSANPTGPAPTVIATGFQVNGVAPNRKQEVQFSEAMDPATINAQSFQVTDSSGKPMPGIVSYDSNFNTASFQPSPALQTNASYTATITTATASSGEVHLAKPYTYAFTTRSDSDTSPISINSVVPAPGATCVSATAPITITFDEAPDASTLSAANLVVTGPSGAIDVKISINVTTTQVVLTPTSSLPSGTITVTVQNIGDLADVMMTAPYTWSFSTACGGGGGGGTTMQYIAPIGPGQVTVDTSGNVTLQLHGATANQAYSFVFCNFSNGHQTQTTCFTVGNLSTDASGDANFTAKFPKPGAWVGDFQLFKGPYNPQAVFAYSTGLGTNYMATLLGGTINTGASASTNGTVSFATSPAPNGLLTFTLTGGPPNTPVQAVEGDLYDGSGDYALYATPGHGTFTTDSMGDVTFTVLPSGHGGDIFWVGQGTANGHEYYGGFVVPQ